ncbi:hypothetical protein [uncultured Legionella sp.]|uniref:hypothetical protein n=1 Tax=uncultured Legionella sp. TaxID=210934 RepID=UPI00260A1A11|nr:hypothetical protein [uncultured Legionella sp.]
MKNLVTEGYIIWLKKFRESNARNTSCVQISTNLIAELKKIESIEQLKSLMASYLTEPNEDSIHQYIPPSFYQKLSEWQVAVTELERSRDKVRSILEVFDPTQQNFLVQLLSEILEHKTAPLHFRTASILGVLSKEPFSELVDYLSTLPYAPYPTEANPGDFAAITPINDYHQASLIMLNNLAASSSLHQYWGAGNGLLQSSLLIYKDMQTKEINLDDEDDFVPPENNGCTIL